jgi:hypothetical protein
MENDKNKMLPSVIGGIIGAIAAVTAIAIIGIILYKIGFSNGSKNSNNTNNTTNTNTSNNVTLEQMLEGAETEHSLEWFNLKFVPSSDMVLLTKAQINEYMGDGASDHYELVAVNQELNKIIYGFVITKSTEEEYTAESYINESLQNIEHSEITKVTMGGKEFVTSEIIRTEDGENFIEDCYVYKFGDKLLCLDFWRTESQANNMAEMIVEL